MNSARRQAYPPVHTLLALFMGPWREDQTDVCVPDGVYPALESLWLKQRWQFGSTATSRIADSPVNHFMPERCSPINRPNSARDRIPSFR